ncbi:MAG: protein YgfX [Gammaproteobacteria bacterium]
MSSNRYSEPLEIEIRPSRLIAGMLLAMHATAAVILAEVPVSMLARLVILLAVVGSFMWNVVLYWHRTPRRLSWRPEAGWQVTDYRGRSEALELLPQAHLGAWIVVAHFRAPGHGRRRSVMLARDSCSAQSLRRLRVMLRYGAPGP